jgi:vancomycin resistance protein YoaR
MMIGVLALILALGGAVAITELTFRDRVVPGVEVAGTDMSGQGRPEVGALLLRLARGLGETPLRFEADGRTFTTTPAGLGWEPDVGATADAALAIGHRGAPWTKLWDRIRGETGGIELDWVARWDAARAGTILDLWGSKVGSASREASLRIADGRIQTSPPRSGLAIDEERILARARSAVGGADIPDVAALPLRRLEPRTDEGDLRAALRRVHRILEGPIRLTARGEAFELSSEELGALVQTRVKDAPDGGRLAVYFPAPDVERVLRPYARRVEVPPEDTEFDIVDGRVRMGPSRSGLVLEPKLASRELLRASLSRDRESELELVVQKPELTRGDAKALGIHDRLSTFTTSYTPGEPRVRNIHLAADFLDGAVVMPDTMFSLNERVGPRTTERGFVRAPVIYEEKFTEDVGGGTSQLATTTFNAAFFAGYPFVDYQPHTYYIDRYPMGREATVSYPEPDLKFRNDTTSAFLIATSTTASSVTVSIYGTDDGRKVTATEPRITRRTVAGFDVVVHRIIRDAKGKIVRRDTFKTSYKSG